jgi:hypothetical protein
MMSGGSRAKGRTDLVCTDRLLERSNRLVVVPRQLASGRRRKDEEQGSAVGSIRNRTQRNRILLQNVANEDIRVYTMV